MIGIFITAILSGLLQGSAWIFPSTVISAILGWGAIILLVKDAFSSGRRVLPAFIAGFIQISIGFHWFYKGISDFTNSGPIVCSILFLVFVIWHSLQLVAFKVIFSSLPESLHKFGLRSPLAWIPCALVFPLMFPWQVGHTQFAFKPFIQIVEIIGTVGLSALIFWCCEIFWINYNKRSISCILIPFSIISCCSFLGALRILEINRETKAINIALVQSSSREQLISFTNSISSKVDLVVWPENSVPSEIHESISNRNNHPYLSKLNYNFHLLLGSRTYRPPTKKFKSAFFIHPDGKIPLPYHKQIFVPFGEYNPFVGIFNFMSGGRGKTKFTAEEQSIVFKLKKNNSVGEVNIAPLICVEDIQPKFPRKATKAGAEILIDIASGQWTKSDIGLKQHNLIASFRTLENRRPLARVSKLGVSTIVSSTGIIQATLPIGVSGVANANVTLGNKNTFYTEIGELPWYIVSVVILILVFYGKFKKLFASS